MASTWGQTRCSVMSVDSPSRWRRSGCFAQASGPSQRVWPRAHQMPRSSTYATARTSDTPCVDARDRPPTCRSRDPTRRSAAAGLSRSIESRCGRSRCTHGRDGEVVRNRDCASCDRRCLAVPRAPGRLSQVTRGSISSMRARRRSSARSSGWRSCGRTPDCADQGRTRRRNPGSPTIPLSWLCSERQSSSGRRDQHRHGRCRNLAPGFPLR